MPGEKFLDGAGRCTIRQRGQGSQHRQLSQAYSDRQRSSHPYARHDRHIREGVVLRGIADICHLVQPSLKGDPLVYFASFLYLPLLGRFMGHLAGWRHYRTRIGRLADRPTMSLRGIARIRWRQGPSSLAIGF